MRPIDADVLENMGYELHRTYQQDANTMVYEVKKIADVPTIEAEPVRRGRWVEGSGMFMCSVCHDVWSTENEEMIKGFNYCPWCGAKMEEEEL